MKQTIKDRESQISNGQKNIHYLEGMGHSRQRDGLGSRNAYINLTADASQNNHNMHKDRYIGPVFKYNKANTRRRNLKMYQMR